MPDFFGSFFSSYILLSITTLVILLGAIYLYINHRIAEQDHKLSSMVNVLQGVIQDTQIIKSQLLGGGGGISSEELTENQYPASAQGGDNGKIVVSDNEEDDEDEDDNDEDVDYDDSESENNTETDANTNNAQAYFETNSLSGSEAMQFVSPIDLSASDATNNSPPIIHMMEINAATMGFINGTSAMPATDNRVEELPDEDIKVEEDANADVNVNANVDIDVENLNEDDDDDFMEMKTDYKKTAVATLRQMVSEKGLCDDPSKLKKPELIKLLE